MSSAPIIALGGSRRLSPLGVRIAGNVAVVLAGSGAGLAIGCSAGADASALSALSSAGLASSAQVFCAFGFANAAPALSSPVGALATSAPLQVLSAASHGAAVAQWAGGSQRLPGPARLSRRTRAVAAAATAGACIVVQGQPGPGSLLLARSVLSRGLPVLAVQVGQHCGPLSPLHQGSGRWVRVSSGPLAGFVAHQWVTAQSPLFS
jgi:predicted Rossmann fold nucleotide-binding protein DprA/Smf involved in DNA uptake